MKPRAMGRGRSPLRIALSLVVLFASVIVGSALAGARAGVARPTTVAHRYSVTTATMYYTFTTLSQPLSP